MPNRPVVRPKDRNEALVRLRRAKMARSAHAFVRGSTARFYEWLDSSGAASLPDGPPVWICGDCHVGNLGPIADVEGRVAVGIRDLDQTVIGNPAHDLVRLGLSLASAARGSDLPGVTTAKMLEAMTEGYRRGLAKGKPRPEDERPECVRLALRQAVSRTWKHLARDRIEDTNPAIPLGRRFWPLSAKERGEVNRLFAAPEARALVTGLRSRKDGAPVEVLDAAYWVKGCSSLGRLRIAVLLGIGKGKQEHCLIDIKEATTAAAPRDGKAPMPHQNAARVVEGARHLSPPLGERMLAARLLDHGVFLRELLPQDLKVEIDGIGRQEAVKAARFLAFVVGRAHGGQLSPDDRKAWRAELVRHPMMTVGAPGWLWTSVVDLMASHEAAYLEHCRRYADEELAG